MPVSTTHTHYLQITAEPASAAVAGRRGTKSLLVAAISVCAVARALAVA